MACSCDLPMSVPVTVLRESPLLLLPPAGHQKKLMLAVKKLCEVQRALQSQSGPWKSPGTPGAQEGQSSGIPGGSGGAWLGQEVGVAPEGGVAQEGLDQRPSRQVPLGTATVFKYPAVPTRPRTEAPLSSAKAPPSTAARGGVTRYALSDGEPDEDDEDNGGDSVFTTG